MSTRIAVRALILTLVLSASAKFSFATDSHQSSVHPIVLNQTGGDPEPIIPPGPVGK